MLSRWKIFFCCFSRTKHVRFILVTEVQGSSEVRLPLIPQHFHFFLIQYNILGAIAEKSELRVIRTPYKERRNPASQSDSLIFLQLVNTSVVQSVFSSALTTRSQIYCRQRNCLGSMFYYEAVQINVNITGSYTLLCNSTMDTYGYIYNNSFNPGFSNENLLLFNDDSGVNLQFIFRTLFQTRATYILVVTTNRPNVTGVFSVIATGPESLIFSPTNTSSKNSRWFRKLLKSN